MGYRAKLRVELVDPNGGEYVVQMPSGVEDDEDFGRSLGEILGALQTLTGYDLTVSDILAHAVVSQLSVSPESGGALVAFRRAAEAFLRRGDDGEVSPQ
ncbi:MAG TPA: hypothetical protein VM529_23360 [Gemmata sp.]|jgi:hypothetical protein|nr:hypothetical protein [Gemmata sp.]